MLCFSSSYSFLDRMRENLYLMRPGLISELRSYAKPPKVVCDVMMCVFLLMGIPQDQVKVKYFEARAISKKLTRI